MDRKAEFLKIWTERVQRDYADALLAWLERETDFFEAPASTRHHGAHPGGLLEHSLNVYHRLRAIVCVETYGATTSDLLAEDVEETVAVLALLHDVCKVNCYHTETRRRKNPETGYWEDYQTYAFRDPLPLGHGEKSLYLIQRHMDLEPEEALAIRWHMGAYDNAVKGDGRALSAAMAASPWVWRLQQADMCAAWVDEREGGRRMKKALCKPCAVEIAARRDREVKQLPGRSEKITCDKCGRRRYGLPYEVKQVFFTGGSRK